MNENMNGLWSRQMEHVHGHLCMFGLYHGDNKLFKSWSGQTKDNKIGSCCFSAKDVVLRGESRDLLTQNQDVYLSLCDYCEKWCSNHHISTRQFIVQEQEVLSFLEHLIYHFRFLWEFVLYQILVFCFVFNVQRLFMSILHNPDK
jgi:hypothetical protein